MKQGLEQMFEDTLTKVCTMTIEAAIQSNLFDKVIVSTDDLNIASIAKSFGAEVPFVRPNELSTDFVFTVPVIKHAIEFFISEGVNIDTVCCLSATAPMVDKNLLVDSYNLFKKNKVRGYVFSATPFPFPIQRAFSIKQNGVPLPDGPVIQSHDRLAKSFSREVIEKKPHIFKIETLTNIRGLFT